MLPPFSRADSDYVIDGSGRSRSIPALFEAPSRKDVKLPRVLVCVSDPVCAPESKRHRRVMVLVNVPRKSNRCKYILANIPLARQNRWHESRYFDPLTTAGPLNVSDSIKSDLS